MPSCINTSSSEYQILKKKSGISDFKLKTYCRLFLNKYGRFPYVDEIAGSNSEPALRERLDMSENGTTIDNLLEATGTQSVEEANIALNNEYRDLEIEVTPIQDEACIEITHRPTVNNFEEEVVEYDNDVNSEALLTEVLDKLSRLYGINIIATTTDELMSDEWSDLIKDAKNTSAFIYNGNIYINTQVADIDAPLHEMMHLFFGSIRFTNPELYTRLLQIPQNFKSYDLMIRTFKNRTQNDINEEILVNEFAKYLVGQESQLDGIDEATQHEIFYNMNRVLDSVLMGQDSVNVMDASDIVNMSLKDLAKKVRSSVLNNSFKGTLDDNTVHRIAMNTKSDLMKEGKLQEYCS
jgi:hypothetical protein